MEWRDAERARRYLAQAPEVPFWAESERALSEQIPSGVGRVLDLGTGDGRLLDLVLRASPGAEAIGLDHSPLMLAEAARRLVGAPVRLIEHDLAEPLPELGPVDLVVSGLAIHHLEDERKRALYAEVFRTLRPGGAFLNLEHVASASPALHAAFLDAIGEGPEDEDPSDRLVSAGTQVGWLSDIGFVDADCHWKWREIALIGGRRPAG